jgi:hypothetical protein
VLLLLQNPGNGTQGLNGVLREQPKGLGVEIGGFGLVPEPVRVLKPAINGKKLT